MRSASRANLVVARAVIEEGTAAAVAAAVMTVAGDDPAMADTTKRIRLGEWGVSSLRAMYSDMNELHFLHKQVHSDQSQIKPAAASIGEVEDFWTEPTGGTSILFLSVGPKGQACVHRP